MRVPVYPDDLIPKRGFKKLAKALHKKWCGPDSISLMSIQELLSKGLGYRDYHDLHQASKLSRPGEPSPAEAEIRLGILSAVKAALRPEKGLATDYAELERLVATLPLFSLSALNCQKLPRPHTIREGSINPDTRTHNLVTPYLAYVAPRPNSDQLHRVASFVAASGNLRDQALLSFLTSGLRPLEFLPAKVGRIETSTAGKAMIKLQPFKASKFRSTIIANPVSIQRHIQTSNLSLDDYLFASSRHLKSPMTTDEFRRICASWALGVGIEPGLVTPQKLRYAVIK